LVGLNVPLGIFQAIWCVMIFKLLLGGKLKDTHATGTGMENKKQNKKKKI